MQLSGEQLSFLARFARTPDGDYLLTILRARLADRDKAARSARGDDVHRHLGAADELDKLIADITDAQTKLNRIPVSVRRPAGV